VAGQGLCGQALIREVSSIATALCGTLRAPHAAVYSEDWHRDSLQVVRRTACWDGGGSALLVPLFVVRRQRSAEAFCWSGANEVGCWMDDGTGVVPLRRFQW
jgi:hypothetical protein